METLQKRSPSALYRRDDGKTLVWYLAVPGHGVMVIRTASSPKDPRGRLRVETGSLFTSAEIGYSSELVV